MNDNVINFPNIKNTNNDDYLPNDSLVQEIKNTLNITFDDDIEEKHYKIQKKESKKYTKAMYLQDLKYVGLSAVFITAYGMIFIFPTASFYKDAIQNSTFVNTYIVSGLMLNTIGLTITVKDICNAWKRLVTNMIKSVGKDNITEKEIRVCSEVIIEETEKLRKHDQKLIEKYPNTKKTELRESIDRFEHFNIEQSPRKK